ncbi:dialkylresorcinol condensing enzyme [Aquisalimonas lutea]|uniref:dialkylrecorsinol condensing enzyme n=1 Tax=Aquisalimonas lutea TaxID=1327750 RepID=UPI0025B36DCB|nr:dialkylrecorsinol condensing enzyme [Aquisalimonas lutea]MDN3517109.1 dialkylresorcinol condensing enzyme [Aquisalimonas lutea]
MTRVLVVYYSQTGQLHRILQALVAPLEAADGVEVDYQPLAPQRPWPFPWTLLRFLDVFPECVYQDPPPLQPLSADADRGYDLVVLGYTVWFLSPAPPVTAFLQSAEGRRLLRDTPVVTVVACRNMWLSAQAAVQEHLAAAGARLSDHVSFVDQGSSLATFFTTPRWMFTGRKDRWLGVFPRAGVAESEITERAPRLGRALAEAVAAGRVDGCAPVLDGLGAVHVDEGLIASERIGMRSFRIWGRLVRRAGPPGSAARKPVLAVYLVFLVLMIATVVPVTLVLRRLLQPLLAPRLRRMRAELEAPSGSARHRLEETQR